MKRILTAVVLAGALLLGSLGFASPVDAGDPQPWYYRCLHNHVGPYSGSYWTYEGHVSGWFGAEHMHVYKHYYYSSSTGFYYYNHTDYVDCANAH